MFFLLILTPPFKSSKFSNIVWFSIGMVFVLILLASWEYFPSFWAIWLNMLSPLL